MQFRPSDCLAGASPLSLDVGYLFVVGSNIFQSMVVQQRVVILAFSQEKMSVPPSTPPSSSTTSFCSLLPVSWSLLLLRNQYAGQEATVRIGHGTADWFQIRKGVHQGCILSPCLFNLYAEYIIRNARLNEAQAGIKIARRNINNIRYADDTTLMAESEELKSLLMKEESEKTGLKLNIQKTKIKAPGPITSWQIDAETVETVTDFVFSGSKITADGDCSHEIKRCLLLGRKAMSNLDSILKNRDTTWPTKVCLSNLWFFQWSCMDVRVEL